MSSTSDRDELTNAWDALHGQVPGNGWQTIGICPDIPDRFQVGRRRSDDREALLINVGIFPRNLALPSGEGFDIERAPIAGAWLALTRRPAARQDIFTTMAEDLIRFLRPRPHGVVTTLHAFLDHVVAWQQFMARSGVRVLSRDAEIGLFGELYVLIQGLIHSKSQSDVIESWKGPLGHIHDFMWPFGSFEVKASQTPGPFHAHIRSLDQLDADRVSQLLLVAVSLTAGTEGRRLPDIIDEIQVIVADRPTAAMALQTRLLSAGYLEAHREHYTQHFDVSNVRCFEVGTSFPGLTTRNIPSAVRSAKYRLDIDLIVQPAFTLEKAFGMVGVF